MAGEVIAIVGAAAIVANVYGVYSYYKSSQALSDARKKTREESEKTLSKPLSTISDEIQSGDQTEVDKSLVNAVESVIAASKSKEEPSAFSDEASVTETDFLEQLQDHEKFEDAFRQTAKELREEHPAIEGIQQRVEELVDANQQLVRDVEIIKAEISLLKRENQEPKKTAKKAKKRKK
ncbi:MAG: hypothetical protein ACE5DI_04905 [Candidatus Micrarchaeia archaeon]